MTFSYCSALEVGDLAPDFKMAYLDGSETDRENAELSDWRGKIVLLDFWASWCGPCQISLPLLSDYNKSVDNADVVIIAINLDKNPARGRKFLKRFPVNYPILSDPEGTAAKAYQLEGMPSAYLIDATGRIRWKHVGFKARDMDEIKFEVARLIKES